MRSIRMSTTVPFVAITAACFAACSPSPSPTDAARTDAATSDTRDGTVMNDGTVTDGPSSDATSMDARPTDGSCGNSITFPATNLVPNASFESGTTGWTSWQGSITSESACDAPDGSHVAIASQTTGTMYSLGVASPSVGSTSAGSTYHASAYVRAGNAASMGRPIQIVIRERATDGTTIIGEDATTGATLGSAFASIEASYTAQGSGNQIDVYVVQDNAVAGDAFAADAITLVETSATDGGSTSADAATDAPTTDSGSVSGEAMPVGDITGWHQIFADDFTTDVPLGSFPSAVSSRWGAYADGWTDTSRNGQYMPSRVISVAGGVMNLHIHTEGGVHMVSAPYPLLPGASSSNGLPAGRYVARFRSDAVPGYKTAWLLWPDSETWPRDGEIDFPEGDLDGTISAFMHRQGATTGGDQDAYSSTARYPTWHTVVIEWTPGQCRFVLDGTVLGTSTSRVPNTPMHWVLQTETALGGAAPADTAAGDLQVDWVTVYVPR